jgi:membrane protein implicated in regulation of membrane protease activity
MDIEPYHWALVASMTFLIIEMITGTLIFVGCAVGVLPVVLTLYITDTVVWERDLALFAMVSVITFMGLRKYFKKPGDQTQSHRNEDINRY